MATLADLDCHRELLHTFPLYEKGLLELRSGRVSCRVLRCGRGRRRHISFDIQLLLADFVSLCFFARCKCHSFDFFHLYCLVAIVDFVWTMYIVKRIKFVEGRVLNIVELSKLLKLHLLLHSVRHSFTYAIEDNLQKTSLIIYISMHIYVKQFLFVVSYKAIYFLPMRYCVL